MNASPRAWGLAAAISAYEGDGSGRWPELPEPPSLRDEVELRDLALDRIRQGLCVFDHQQRLRLFNRQYAEMYDLDPGQLWIGMTLRDVVDLRYAAGTGPGMAPAEYAAWRNRIGVANQVVNTEVTLPDGRVHAIHHEPTLDGGWVATFEDITARRQAEADIRHMAHHDALTGLPNRARFIKHLQQTLARLHGNGSLEDHRAARVPDHWMIAVLFFDLDRFKGVNDTLGHAAGDRLLQLVAERAGRCLRGGDMLARFGGDEFAMLLDETVTGSEEAAEVAQRVISAVSAPYMLDGHEAAIGASVGIVLCTRDDGDDATATTLLRQADVALYRAKTAGQGSHCFFEAGKTAERR